MVTMLAHSTREHPGLKENSAWGSGYRRVPISEGGIEEGIDGGSG